MVSKELKGLFERLDTPREEERGPGPYVSVEHLTSRVGAFYERMRTLVDYKDYQFIRRSAIRRILKRQLYLERVPNAGAALLSDLVSGGYLRNNAVPESEVVPLEGIIRKWTILSGSGFPVLHALDFAAIEIEEHFFPDQAADTVAEHFFERTRMAVVYRGNGDDTKELVTYAACRRALLNEDQPALLYALLKRITPELSFAADDETQLSALASRLKVELHRARRIAEDALVWRVAARIKNEALYHAVLLELVRTYGKGAQFILDDEEKTKEATREIIEKKQSQQKRILRASAKRAIVYLFLTKIILGIAVEWPYEHFILKSENYLALGTNTLFHPLLLFLMVTFRRRDKGVVSRITEGLAAVARGDKSENLFIRPPVKTLTFFFVVVFYFILFVLSFGAILWLLLALHFNPVSIILFFVFLTLVSYFGIRIRAASSRWEPIPERASTLGLLWHLFTFPIVRTGRWISVKFAAINIFVFLLDFLVEVPFKAFLGIFDASLSFIKESKVDTY